MATYRYYFLKERSDKTTLTKITTKDKETLTDRTTNDKGTFTKWKTHNKETSTEWKGPTDFNKYMRYRYIYIYSCHMKGQMTKKRCICFLLLFLYYKT